MTMINRTPAATAEAAIKGNLVAFLIRSLKDERKQRRKQASVSIWTFNDQLSICMSILARKKKEEEEEDKVQKSLF